MKLGFMKNETTGEEMDTDDVYVIRAKMYAFRMSDGVEKKGKGVWGYVVRGGLTFDDYYRCLEDRDRKHMVSMNGIRSRHQDVYSDSINKVGLSANDDKRVICEDGIHTLAYGHCKLISV
jgi:hypothetical protein